MQHRERRAVGVQGKHSSVGCGAAGCGRAEERAAGQHQDRARTRAAGIGGVVRAEFGETAEDGNRAVCLRDKNGSRGIGPAGERSAEQSRAGSGEIGLRIVRVRRTGERADQMESAGIRVQIKRRAGALRSAVERRPAQHAAGEHQTGGRIGAVGIDPADGPGENVIGDSKRHRRIIGFKDCGHINGDREIAGVIAIDPRLVAIRRAAGVRVVDGAKPRDRRGVQRTGEFEHVHVPIAQRHLIVAGEIKLQNAVGLIGVTDREPRAAAEKFPPGMLAVYGLGLGAV